jgi:hypothetical protein
VVSVGGLVAATALATPSYAADAASELANRYAPVVRLVEQEKSCGHGEPYEPTDVDVLLKSPDVALRGPWDTTSIVKISPSASDLAKGLFGYNLDFPGHALAPGCTYDEWSHRVTADLPTTTYAHVATEGAYPGQLALQYWFFYLFNDFNDKHEGDWEMVQLDFPASTPEDALGVEPTEVGFSQHEGAERARWGDDKLTIVDGTHPVVYPALGSHANYFGSKLYLGRSAAQGVGCDDTVGPSNELRPVVRLIPTTEHAALQAYPWLGFVGRWGERHSGFYNGPTGPNTKTQWMEPISWAHEEWRDSSFTVPAGSSLGTSATDFFCGAVATGSAVLTAFVDHPSPVLLALAAVLVLILWLASRTRWDLSTPLRVRRRRPWGSLITSALRLYGSRPQLFLGLGLFFVPLGLLITGLQYLLFRHGPISPLVDAAGETNASVGGLALGLGIFITVLGLNVVQAAVAAAVVRLDAGKEITALGAYRLALDKLPRLFASLVLATVVVVLAALTGAGLVIGIWLVIRWSLLPAVLAVEDAPERPLRHSAQLVRRYWWRTASITVFVTGLGLLLGPLIGTAMLFLTSASFDFVNLVSALVYVVTLPFVAVTTTYLYFDLLVRHTLEDRESTESAVLPAEI